MKLSFFTAILAICAAFSAQLAHAEPAFSVTSPIVYDTGDTWSQQGHRYRLYGVQACIRGTAFVSASGAKGDCGAASMTMLAGLFGSLQVNCTPVSQNPDDVAIVICAGVSHDRPLDIGGAMISSGFAFAAEKLNGAPVNLAYFASEIRARADHAGLWGAASFTHPVQMLRDLARQARPQP